MKHFFRNIRLSFDRSFSSGQTKQLMWLGGLMLVVYGFLVALSFVKELYTPVVEEHGRWYNVLFQLLDPGEGSDSMTPLFAVIVAMFGLVIFGGMLISVMSNVLERRVESYVNGETDYNIYDHIVVIGFNQSVPSLLNKIHQQYADSFILLLSDKESESIRDLVRSNLSKEIEESLIVIKGIQTAEDDIMRLKLSNNVKKIYILGEEDDDCHDSNNLECAKLIAGQICDKEARIHCHVQINSDTTYSVLQRVDFCKTYNMSNELVFAPFNFNEIWAQKVIATVPDAGYKSLDGNGITSDSKEHVHLIVIGVNEMASSIAVNAAHVLHFPNFKEGNLETCSHITFIDNNISDFSKLFRSQYRNLFSLSRWREIDGQDCLNTVNGWIDPFAPCDSTFRHLVEDGEKNFMDIQWEFISGDVYDEPIQSYLKQCSQNKGEITTIALCFDSSEMNAAVCLALPDDICKTANQILVKQEESPATIDLIKQLPNKENVKAFGMRSKCYEENLISDRYGKITNALYNGVNLKDNNGIQKTWDDLSTLNKWSSIYNANMLYYRLRSLGLRMNDLTEENVRKQTNSNSPTWKQAVYTEHNRWNTEKLLLGFAPLTKEEQDKYVKGWLEYKSLKNKGLKHGDICSNKKLDKIDPGSRKWDELLITQLWDLHESRLYNSNNL